MDIFGYHLPMLAGAAGVFASVYGAFAKFDADQSDENRKFTRDWLLGLKADDRQWSNSFKELFAYIFGPRHFSLKCFWRSAALSAVLSVCLLTYGIARYDDPAGVTVIEIIMAAAWTVVAIIADYFSLWKTRVLLTKSNMLNNGIVAIAILFLDAFATLTLFLVIDELINLFAGVVLILSGKSSLSEVATSLYGIIPTFLKVIYSPTSDVMWFFRLLLLAPLLTSAWLWVYLIVAYGMRAINRVPPLLSVLSKVLDVQSHPVKSIGYVAGMASAIIIGFFGFL